MISVVCPGVSEPSLMVGFCIKLSITGLLRKFLPNLPIGDWFLFFPRVGDTVFFR